MNKQEVKAASTAAKRPTGGTPTSRPPRRRRPNPALLRLLQRAMMVLAGMVVVIGILLLVLPTFRVQTISVEGVAYYTEEQIIKASGISIGQEILGIDTDEVYRSIWDACIYVDELSIELRMNSVTIVVKERSNVLYTEFAGRYFSVDSTDFRVLEQSYDESAFADFLKVELPQIESISMGKPINFENKSLNLSYVGELIEALDANGVIETVSFLDCSSKFNASYVMDQTCRVNLGRVDELGDKLRVVEGILEMKGDLGGMSAVVDVTNLRKPTFRLVGGSELLMSE